MALADVFQSIQKKLSFSKSVEISGIKFELGLLSFEEEMKTEAVPEGDLEPIIFYNQTRLQTLSYAIRKINGEEIPAVVEVPKGDTVEKKQGSLYVKDFLSLLPIKIVDQLFDIYVDLKDEADATLAKDMKYTWFKTPEQREKEAEERKNTKEEEKSTGEENEPAIVLKEIPKPDDEEEKK